MKALCWHGKNDVRVDNVPDPKVVDPRDLVLKITSTAICGSDLHLLDGFMPTMQSGDVLGHEFMGEVVETGPQVSHVKTGDRVLVPFNIACGSCFFCKKELFSCCDTSNRKPELGRQAMGQAGAGLFGYSHMTGGYAGGQAEYVRVPFADVGAFKVPDDLPDEKVLFLTDIFPTGYMAAEQAGIEKGDTVAIWGCGPVGQFTIQSAWMLGAGRVIAIDTVPERLQMAREKSKAETIDFMKDKVYDVLMEMTKGRGPDRCIDAVGCEAHSTATLDSIYDTMKTAVGMETDRPHVIREAIMCCRKGGTLSIPGVYVGFGDKIPIGAMMNKGLTIKTGQTHTHRYVKPLMERVRKGDIDPSFVITHRAPLAEAPTMYKTFRNHQDGCVKVVLKP
jgi:threonine dehydrogenase-like Zn-dependent dehydrogenase